MSTFSSLPSKNSNTADTLAVWLAIIVPKQCTYKDVSDSRIVYDILEEHLPRWLTENSPDITHFAAVLGLELEHERLITRVLYECMEKNELNVGFIRDRNLNTNLPKIDPLKYPQLSKLVSIPNLDFIKTCYGNSIHCLDYLLRFDLLSTIAKTIKTLKYQDVKSYKSIDLADPQEVKIINYVFKDKDLYQVLSSKNTNTKMFRKFRDLSTLINFLYTSNTQGSNLEIILNNLNQIFKTRDETLTFLTGLALGIAEVNVLHSALIEAYKFYYPEELKVVQSMQSLGITDFETTLTTILNTQAIQKTESMEMPLL